MKLSAKARKRLTLLRDFFKTVPKKRVNLNTYASPADHGEEMTYEDRLSIKECKAVGCLLGWGTAVPQLRKLGLSLDNPDADIADQAAEVFDIPESLADSLFDARNDMEDQDDDEPVSDKKIALRRLKRVLRKGFDVDNDSVYRD